MELTRNPLFFFVAIFPGELLISLYRVISLSILQGRFSRSATLEDCNVSNKRQRSRVVRWNSPASLPPIYFFLDLLCGFPRLNIHFSLWLDTTHYLWGTFPETALEKKIPALEAEISRSWLVWGNSAETFIVRGESLKNTMEKENIS